MSQLTANSVWPVVSSLPTEEKAKLIQQLQKAVKPLQPQNNRPKKRKSVNDKVVEKLGEAFATGNTAMLAAQIMQEY